MVNVRVVRALSCVFFWGAEPFCDLINSGFLALVVMLSFYVECYFWSMNSNFIVYNI